MSIKVSELGNGLKVVTETMPHLESAAMGVWVKAGARNEKRSQHGISHLLEHMAFKGTRTRTARDIAEQVENVGGDLNAATSVETTAYYARVMGEDVPLATDILADILTSSTFEERELEREKHVILQEIGASLDSPEEAAMDAFQNTVFDGQPIGRPILGTPQSVNSFSSSEIQTYLDEHYHGPNMVLAAAGAVDHEALVRQAENKFASFRSELTYEAEPAIYVGGKNLIERDIMEVQLLLGFEGRAYHAKDFYASQLLGSILGGGMSSRLFQEIREIRGLCYSVYAYHWGFSDTGIFGVHAATGPEDLAELLPAIVEQLRITADHIDQAELDRARAQIRAGLMMSMESPSARAGQIARQLLLFGRHIPNEELMDRLNALSVERIKDLAGRLFEDSVPTLTAVGPISGLAEIAERVLPGSTAISAAAQ